MTPDLLAQREKYVSSGKVNGLRLILLLPLPIGVGLLMASVLCALFRWGFYYSLIVPLVAALPVAAAVYLTVRWSHCRNQWVAAIVGLLAGLALYPGQFQIDLAVQAGPQALPRVDLLPAYIDHRMATDAARDRIGRVKPPDKFFNWLGFAADATIVLVLVTGAAVHRATRVYCENCGRWARLAVASAPPGAASAIAHALAAGRLGDLPAMGQHKAQVGAASSTISVESCRSADKNDHCAIYLRLQETEAGSIFRKSSTVHTLVSSARLNVAELSLLAARLPGLAPVAPLLDVPLVDVPIATLVTSATAHDVLGQIPTGGKPVPPAYRAPVKPLAVVEALPQHTADKVINKGNTAIAISLSFFPIVTFLAGIGLCVLAWWVRPLAPAADPTEWLVVAGLLAAGFVALAFGLVVCVVNVDFFNFRYGYSVVRNEIQLRADPWVRPNDPRAIYVDMVPRERWSDLVCDKPSDCGFVLVDTANRQVLFEGIKERYRIPVEALLSCEAVCTQPQAGSFAFYATVLQAHIAEPPSATHPVGGQPKMWEASFMIRPVTFRRYTGAYRRASCEALRDQIRALGGPGGPRG